MSGDDRAAAPPEAFGRLVEIMRRLRGPDGCPWDREQDYRSLRRYTLEEAYEVVQAIDVGDPGALADELGDLLLQVVFLAQIGAERGEFTVADVATAISDKLVRRHPHVFGDGRAADADEVVRNWEAIKRRERGGGSVLDGVPRGLPGLERAQKLGKRAAQLRFDWPDAEPVLGKVREELDELEAAIRKGDEREREEELGDVLFALASLARHLGLSAEVAVAGASAKFERRFRLLERELTEREEAPDAGRLEELWRRAKRAPAREPE